MPLTELAEAVPNSHACKKGLPSSQRQDAARQHPPARFLEEQKLVGRRLVVGEAKKTIIAARSFLQRALCLGSPHMATYCAHRSIRTSSQSLNLQDRPFDVSLFQCWTMKLKSWLPFIPLSSHRGLHTDSVRSLKKTRNDALACFGRNGIEGNAIEMSSQGKQVELVTACYS